jgi:hypothetical protein
MTPIVDTRELTIAGDGARITGRGSNGFGTGNYQALHCHQMCGQLW